MSPAHATSLNLTLEVIEFRLSGEEVYAVDLADGGCTIMDPACCCCGGVDSSALTEAGD